MEKLDNTMKVMIEEEQNKQIIKNLELKKFIQFKLNKEEIIKEDFASINEIALDSKNIIGEYNKVYFEEIDSFQNLEKIAIRNLGVSSENITRLNNIQQIEFKDCEVENIAQLSNVQQLLLIHSEIENVEELGQLENLTELQLINMKMDNFDFLNKLEKLKTLKVKNVEDFVLAKIDYNLPIEYLSIEKVKQLDFKVLAKYKNLKVLSVDRKEAENWENELKDLKSKGIEILLNDIYQY